MASTATIHVLDFLAVRIGVDRADLLGRSRLKRLTIARQVCFLALREATLMSYEEIGRDMDRDHTTVMSGARACRALVARDAGIAELLTGAIEAAGVQSPQHRLDQIRQQRDQLAALDRDIAFLTAKRAELQRTIDGASAQEGVAAE
jgi:hypothetical protein